MYDFPVRIEALTKSTFQGITPTILAVRVCMGSSYEYTTTRGGSTALEFVSQRHTLSTKTTTTHQQEGIDLDLEEGNKSELSEGEKGEVVQRPS